MANVPLIRDFTDSDYEALAGVESAAFPEQRFAAEWHREQDYRRDLKYLQRRWVAEHGNVVLGVGHYTQLAEKHEPGRFYISITVHPEHRRRGYGAAIYDSVLDGLTEHNPLTLRGIVREDQPGGLHMVEKHGYHETHRVGELHLDPTQCDLTRFAGIEDRLRSEGIEIKTLRELQGDLDRDRERKLYDLDWEVTRDEPGSEDDTRADFETCLRDGLYGPQRLYDGYFIAVHDSEYIGLCLLNTSEAGGAVDHGITGVKRGWRRKGIATALKVRAVEYARAAGHPLIKTASNYHNLPMLTLNERFGFIRQPEWIGFEKMLGD